MGLQLICLDNVGHAGSRPGRGPFADLILGDIFPESMPASLSELVLGWETHFELEEFLDATRPTTSGPSAPGRSPTGSRKRSRGRWWARRRAAPTRGTSRSARPSSGSASTRCTASSSPSGPSPRPGPSGCGPATSAARPTRAAARAGASACAIRSHYDVSNSFYELWLGPSMMYSSAMWAPATTGTDSRARPAAEDRLLRGPGAAGTRLRRVLDVGRGWGEQPLRRPTSRLDLVTDATGLTLKLGAELDLPHRHPVPGALAFGWTTGTTTPRASRTTRSSRSARSSTLPGTVPRSPERIATYRRFFRSCMESAGSPGGG